MKTKMKLSDYLRENLENSFDELKKENDRYNSWEHCYKFFRICQKCKNPTCDYDLAALNLAFYLASWGMYRGSSFILNYDYKIFKPLIKELFNNETCDFLWNIDVDLMSNESYKESYIKAISEAKRIITKCLKKYSSKDKISETLITKILMGIYACTPAYDRFFCAGLKELNGLKELSNEQEIPSSYNKDSITKLWEFIKAANKKEVWQPANEKEYKLHTDNRIKYPIMKLVDLCFWKIGYNNSIKAIKVKGNEITLMWNIRDKKDENEKIYEINKIITKPDSAKKEELIKKERDELIKKIERADKINYSDKNSEDINIRKEELIESIKNRKIRLFNKELQNDLDL